MVSGGNNDRIAYASALWTITLLFSCAGAGVPMHNAAAGSTSSFDHVDVGFIPLTRFRNDSNLGHVRGRRQPAPVSFFAGAPSEPLTNRGNVQYIGLLGVGTPTQQIPVMFDTGSSDVWVSFFRFYGPAPFHRKASSTLTCPRQPAIVSIQYGRGQITGEGCRDVLTVGGIHIPPMPIVLTEHPDIDGRMFQGIVGLASLSHQGADGTFINHLRSADVNVFTFSLMGIDSSSKLFFGLDPAIEKDTLVYAPSLTQAWWTFEGGIAIGDTLLIDSSPLALDTGTSFFAMPEKIFNQFKKLLLPNGYDTFCYESVLNTWKCNPRVASAAAIVYIQFGGWEFPVYPEDVLVCSGSNVDCVLEIMMTGEGMPIVLGDTFLRTVRAVFDIAQTRMGLSPRKDHLPTSPSTWRRLRERGPLPITGLWPVVDRGNPLLKPYAPVMNPGWSTVLWYIGIAMSFGGVVGWGTSFVITFWHSKTVAYKHGIDLSDLPADILPLYASYKILV
eukprot:TRINITY_DN63380_c0_g1_i1.p1 TRINITY_DN63380_c0_g1~~TRINITY_DN63380_c0_g1_i1.p1  ORF type:complete len:501 (+),score=42.79 TRINITY_DN63380_c0_g1_i1:35-1537(+)